MKNYVKFHFIEIILYILLNLALNVIIIIFLNFLFTNIYDNSFKYLNTIEDLSLGKNFCS